MNSEAPLDKTEQKAMCENQAQSQGMVLQYTHGLKITGTPIHFQLKIEQLNTSLKILPCIASNLTFLEITFSQWGVYKNKVQKQIRKLSSYLTATEEVNTSGNFIINQ